MNSLRFKIPFVTYALVVPLLLLLIVSVNYAVNVVHNQVASSNKKTIALYMNQIDNEMNEVDAFLLGFVGLESDLILLDSDKEQIYQGSKIRLMNRLVTAMSIYDFVDAIFIYTSKWDDILHAFKPGSGLVTNPDIGVRLKSIMRDERLSSVHGFITEKWSLEKIGSSHYLFHILKYGNVYMGAWVNVANIDLSLDHLEMGQSAFSLFVDSFGNPLSYNSYIEEHQIDLGRPLTNYYFTGEDGKFLVVGEESSTAELALVTVLPNDEILQNLPLLQYLVYILTALSVLFVPLYFIFIRKTLLIPLKGLLAIMRRIRDGNMHFRVQRMQSPDELADVAETFNDMMDQIQRLQREVYEEQVRKQKAELQHLQLQLNPHFFMNTLNIIHSLAEMKKYETIQELILRLVQYFRYILKSSWTYVALRDELSHVENYLGIQELRYPNKISLELKVPDILLNAQVPPLIIQTFVENTVKHASVPSFPLIIRVAVNLAEEPGGAKLHIRVSDNGKGFDPSVLERLTADAESTGEDDGRHIGIRNVQRRLKLLYGAGARIAFCNSPGATVEMSLPIITERALEEQNVYRADPR